MKGEIEVVVGNGERKRRLLLASVAKKAASWAMTESLESLLSGDLTNSKSNEIQKHSFHTQVEN